MFQEFSNAVSQIMKSEEAHTRALFQFLVYFASRNGLFGYFGLKTMADVPENGVYTTLGLGERAMVYVDGRWVLEFDISISVLRDRGILHRFKPDHLAKVTWTCTLRQHDFSWHLFLGKKCLDDDAGAFILPEDMSTIQDEWWEHFDLAFKERLDRSLTEP